MRYFLISFLLFLFIPFTRATELPPVHEAARLSIAIERSVQSKQWEKANSQLSELRSLDTPQPVDTYYYEGLVLLKQGRLESAEEILTHYVITSGESGTFYKSALEAITSSKVMMTKEKVVEPSMSQIQRSDHQGTSDGYVKSLQALYMVDNAVDALVLQANSLLASHSYTGERLKTPNSKKGIQYKIQIKDREIVVQEKDYRGGLPVLKATVQPVLGVDPFISFGCSSAEYKCWMNDPVDKHSHWLLLDYDEVIAGELASTISKLIIELQGK